MPKKIAFLIEASKSRVRGQILISLLRDIELFFYTKTDIEN